MSENVDTVLSIYAAWDRRDYGWIDWADPAIDFVLADGPAPGRWTGLAGMWQGWSEVLAPWDEWRAEKIECRDLDEGRVLALIRFSGRGKASGVDVGKLSGSGANVFHFRDGKVTKLVAYFHQDRALADLGLED